MVQHSGSVSRPALHRCQGAVLQQVAQHELVSSFIHAGLAYVHAYHKGRPLLRSSGRRGNLVAQMRVQVGQLDRHLPASNPDSMMQQSHAVGILEVENRCLCDRWFVQHRQHRQRRSPTQGQEDLFLERVLVGVLQALGQHSLAVKPLLFQEVNNACHGLSILL